MTGADRRNYFFRVRDLIDFLRTEWGAPDKVVRYPHPSDLEGEQGIITFTVTGWSDAGGHATLYDGRSRSCYDSCYFYEKEAAHTTTQANFWSLPCDTCL
ncbi:MAG: type VI secretion system amidase effector protein Tae4 [Syntrophobacterales bacterium]|nr:type VI secretion system amidase effector protein Tae4 [Syntrophobacterales bacterium]